MKFGIRKPSFKKSFAARTSWKRVVRHNLGLKAPRGWGWITNPKKAAYNRVYNRTTIGLGDLFKGGRSKRYRSSAKGGSGESAGCLLGIVAILVFGALAEAVSIAGAVAIVLVSAGILAVLGAVAKGKRATSADLEDSDAQKSSKSKSEDEPRSSRGAPPLPPLRPAPPASPSTAGPPLMVVSAPALAVATLLRYLAGADRRLDAREIALAREVMSHLLPDPYRSSGNFEGSFRSLPIDAASIERSLTELTRTPPEFRLWAVEALARLTGADGRLTPKEQERLAQVRAALDV